jgi:hypothetical protein
VCAVVNAFVATLDRYSLADITLAKRDFIPLPGRSRVRAVHV